MSLLRVAVSGSSGLVGRALLEGLTSGGHSVRRITRSKEGRGKDDIYWDPAGGEIDARLFDGVDAVVHLAGENIAARPWTKRQKERIRSSRVDGTRLLASTLARLGRRPGVLISASAIGIYGDRGEAVDESSAPGTGYLAEVCRDWEAAAEPAEKAGIRVVNLRIGVVLSPDGGALGKMLTPFRLGLGGPVGDGRQPMSWIALDELVEVVRFALQEASLSGPVNATAPGAVANAEFGRTLGKVLRRPAVIPLPAFMVRLLFGEMGEALLLGGAEVRPKRLLDAGYRFRHPHLEPALRHLLGR